MAHMYAITGALGAGKTTMASIIAWAWKLAVEARGGHVRLFANYDLRGADRLDKTEDWFRVAEAHGSICVWDESHRSFDSRKFGRLENILATEILTFARKMASVHVFATPSVNRLDTRLREMIEVLIVVRKGNGGTYFDFYDFQADFGGKYGKYLHTKFLPHYNRRKVHRLNLFDSYSFVNEFPLPKTEREGISFMRDLEEAHIRGLERSRKGIIDVDHAIIS